jgi:hypothetical protein
MANGDVVLRTALQKVVKLLDAATATTDGAWIDCENYTQAYIVVTLGGGSMSIVTQGSCAVDKPANATDEVTIGGSALTATGAVSLVNLPRWIKCDGTITTGPVTAVAVLRRS